MHEQRINEEKEKLIKQALREHAYDLTFKQLEELTGIPKTTLCNHFKKTTGWYQCAKKMQSLITEAHKEARLAWAKENLENEWYDHMDLDERWFYVTSGGRRLKIPAGSSTSAQLIPFRGMPTKLTTPAQRTARWTAKSSPRC